MTTTAVKKTGSAPAKKKLLPPIAPATRKQKPHELLESTRPYLIEALLPAYEVHLLGGPSGAGKTRWMFQLLEQWKAGQSIFGFKSHPVPALYIGADRSYASVCDTLRDLGMDPLQWDILPALDMESDQMGYSIPWLFKQIKDYWPEKQLIIVEGIGTFVPGGKTSDYNVVSKFLRELGRMCRRRKITILGIHHTAKEKGKDGYGNDREKLLGSAAWAGFSETIFMIDPVQSEDPKSPYRKLSVFPRNGTSSFTVQYKFGESGALQELTPSEKFPGAKGKGGRPKNDEVRASFERYFSGLRAEGKNMFELKDLLNKANDLPRATIVRHLEQACDDGVVERVGRGAYKLPAVDKTFEGMI